MSFALRVAGSRDQQQLAYNVVSQILLLLAPLCKSLCQMEDPFVITVWRRSSNAQPGLNAFAYMTVSRLIYYVHIDQKVMRIRAIVLTRIFVWLDVICFLIQAVGGSMLSGDDKKITDIGMNIYIAGISVQQAIILAFSVLTVQFFRELDEKGRTDRPVRLTKWLVLVLIANFVLITVSFRVFPQQKPKLTGTRSASSSGSSSSSLAQTPTTLSSQTKSTCGASTPSPCSWALFSSTSSTPASSSGDPTASSHPCRGLRRRR